VYYQEWNRNAEPDPVRIMEDTKLMYGMLYSLRQFCSKMSTNHDERTALRGYKTSTYKLHYYESLTGVKFIMLTDPSAALMQEQLATIYREIFVEYVIKNPLYKLDSDTIKCDLFQSKLLDYLKLLT